MMDWHNYILNFLKQTSFSNHINIIDGGIIIKQNEIFLLSIKIDDNNQTLKEISLYVAMDDVDFIVYINKEGTVEFSQYYWLIDTEADIPFSDLTKQTVDKFLAVLLKEHWSIQVMYYKDMPIKAIFENKEGKLGVYIIPSEEYDIPILNKKIFYQLPIDLYYSRRKKHLTRRYGCSNDFGLRTNGSI